MYVGGWLIMLGGIASSWLFVALNVGLTAVFSEGYLSFLALSGATMLGTLLGLANLGCLLAICGARGREWMKPLAVWVVVPGAARADPGCASRSDDLGS